jgi:hypothetical protein
MNSVPLMRGASSRLRRGSVSTLSASPKMTVEFMSCCLNLSGLMDRDGVANVGDDCQSMKIRDHCAQQFNSFAGKFDRLNRKTGDVATRFCQRSDHATAQRVHSYCEHDGDRRGYLHCCGNCAANRHNDVDLEPSELGRDFAIPFRASLGRAIFDCNVAAFDPAKLAQSLNKRRGPLAPDRGRASAQKPYGWHFPQLLCACGERPK